MVKTKYFLGTAKQVGEFVANYLCEEFNTGKEFEFPDFSFAIKSDRCPTENLRDIAEWSDGWYGVQFINTHFDTDETATICGNYFGGGCAVAGSLWIDELDCPEYVAPVIANVIRRSIEMQETVNNNTVYIVEFDNALTDEKLAQLRNKYEKFKLQWMADHGYTLDALVASLAESLEDSNEPIWETYEIWENDRGFDGEIWPCFDEWLENENKD